MRYPPQRRRSYPNRNDMRLWRVLDKLKLGYEKIAWIAPFYDGRHTNYFVAARLEGGECIDWCGSFRTGGQSAKTKKQEKTKKEFMDANNIPCLWLNRFLDEPAIELKVRRWLRKRKNEN